MYPHTIWAGYYGFTLLSLCPFVCRPVFSFPDDTLSECQWMFTKLGMCIDIVKIWFGVPMGKFRQFLTDICRITSGFLFQDDNLSKYQQIFTKLGMCIDIVQIWFGIALNGQLLSIFDSYLSASCP